MHLKWIAVAAVNGFLAVALGAFGAHALKPRLSETQLATFEVGVRYHMYHALALLAVAWMASVRPSALTHAAGVCMVLGIVFFSGSLYLLPLTQWKWLGPVTPVGGLCLMLGWLLLASAALRPTP